MGTGYVGLLGSICVAERDTSVPCLEIVRFTFNALWTRPLPFYEPDRGNLFNRARDTDRLQVTNPLNEVVSLAVFISVAPLLGRIGEPVFRTFHRRPRS